MHRLRLILLILFVQSFSVVVMAQNQVQIAARMDKVPFRQFVQEVERTSAYHFYYDPAELDSITVSAAPGSSPLGRLLDSAFGHTDFHYGIDGAGRVFITRRAMVQTALPLGFFTPVKPGEEPVAMPVDAVAERPAAERLQSVENKLFEIGPKTSGPLAGNATLAGYVRDVRSGEGIAGASVYTEKPSVGITTDQYGYFSLTLPKGRRQLLVSSTGMKDSRRQITLYGNGNLNIELQEYIPSLKSVTVVSQRTSNTASTQMGTTRLTIAAIRQVPVIFGEADVLKVVLSLPGVTSVGEAGNGFNVRGGASDQNLILFNDATVYNPSHLFGFFSAFNPDVVKGLELYKSAIPEKYGGRLSSVLDVTAQDGNSKKWTGAAGIGPLTSRVVIEGPLKKDKTSLIAGVRGTYSDWLLKNIPDSYYRNSRANFYDASLRISHTINSKNSLYLTGYISSDQFSLRSDTTYRYSNRNANIKWKHIFNNQFNGVLTAGTDHYQYAVSATRNTVNAFRLGFDINQQYLRADFNLAPGNRHTFNFGFNTIYYKLHPGTFEPSGGQSLVTRSGVPAEQAIESALYAGDQYELSDKISVHAGIRYAVFNYLGPHKVNEYAAGLPRDTLTITKTAGYNAGKVIQTYSAPEIRLALRYALSDDASFKFSFNTLQQYIHLLSNSVSISPTDTWKLSDPNIRPQQGNQLSLGFYRNYRSGTIETSVEVYYKQIRHYLDYKSGAKLLLNPHIETDVINTWGKAYGFELLVKKTTGKLNGWFSYTFSRTFLQIDDPLAGQTINHGNYYPASFDKPHNVNLIGNYRFSHRYSLSVNALYSTGRPITLPIAIFNLGGATSLLYSDRNQYRTPDYFRTDVSFNLSGNHRVKQRTHNSWSFGLYNVTARQNVYSIYFVQENGAVKGYRLSIFGTIIPFVTYNIKF